MNYSGACQPSPTISPPVGGSGDNDNVGWVGLGLLLG